MRIFTLILLICLTLPVSAQISLTIVTNTTGLMNLIPSATRPAVAIVPLDGSTVSFWRYTPGSIAAIGTNALSTSTGIGRWLRTPIEGDLILNGVPLQTSLDGISSSILATSNNVALKADLTNAFVQGLGGFVTNIVLNGVPLQASINDRALQGDLVSIRQGGLDAASVASSKLKTATDADKIQIANLSQAVLTAFSGGLSVSNFLGTISNLTQTINAAGSSAGFWYDISTNGTLSGTNAPAIAVLQGDRLLSNGTNWGKYAAPPVLLADGTVTRAKLSTSLQPYLDDATTATNIIWAVLDSQTNLIILAKTDSTVLGNFDLSGVANSSTNMLKLTNSVGRPFLSPELQEFVDDTQTLPGFLWSIQDSNSIPILTATTDHRLIGDFDVSQIENTNKYLVNAWGLGTIGWGVSDTNGNLALAVRSDGVTVGNFAGTFSLPDVVIARSAITNLNTSGTFLSGDYCVGDGVTDDLMNIKAMFAQVSAYSGPRKVIFEEGTYLLGLTNFITLPSNCTVDATAAKFVIPAAMPTNAFNYPRNRIFITGGISNFVWQGGSFEGSVFDKYSALGTNQGYRPEMEVPLFLFNTTSVTNTPSNVSITGLRMKNWPGNALRFYGSPGVFGLEGFVTTAYASNLVVSDCVFDNVGGFQFDYGWQWQVLTFDTNYSASTIQIADAYMPAASKIGAVTMASGTSLVAFDNDPTLVPIAPSDARDHVVTFYGTTLPSNITRGLQYFVVGSSASGIQVSATFGGPAITFASSSSGAKMLFNMTKAWYEALGEPGVFSGTVAVYDAQNVRYTDNYQRSPGDGHQFWRTTRGVMSGNTINSAAMGALFLADQCSDWSVTGNTVDGSFGSRTISCEFGSTNIVFSGNTFRGGGRGVWINRPMRLVMSNNTFDRMNLKTTPDWFNGRITFITGTWEQFASIYVTSRDGTPFGSISFTGNIMNSELAATAFSLFATGTNLVFANNTFTGVTNVTGLSSAQNLAESNNLYSP